MTNPPEVQSKRDLLKIRAFDTNAYASYALTSLTAYCVFWLQEWKITTNEENLGVACHRMFPSKFCLVGWPEFPDLKRIGRSVLQMRPKYRNLATSVSSKGVFLNQRGLEEAAVLVKQLGPPIFEGQVRASVPTSLNERAERGKAKPRSVIPENIIAKIQNSHIYKLYETSRFHEAEAIDLIGLLEVYDHTPSAEKRRKMKELEEAAKELKDEKTLTFLAEIKERFGKYLNR